MTQVFNTLFTRYPVKTRRFFEILPGIVSWTLILFPVWGSFFMPVVLAYFVLFFDIYWLTNSFSLATSALIASRRIALAEREKWIIRAEELPDAQKVAHVIIIPNYKERVEKIRQALHAIAKQTFPTKRIYIVLAMEKREEGAQEKADVLTKEFKHMFGDMVTSLHAIVPGEVAGKSSNEAYAGRMAYEKWVVKSKKIDLDFATVTTVDTDSLFDKQYFAYLTYAFLKSPRRYNTFWQSANVSHNNFWKVPAPVRVMAFFNSLMRTALLMQGDGLIPNSTYSLSLRLIVDIDFWDTDVIPEDYRVFFKAFFHKKGQAWVDPIFLKTSIDAPQSEGFWATLKNKYEQERRWSWGVSDYPLFVKWWFTVPGVPFVRKTKLLYHVVLDHFMWPANWFILTVAANVIPFVNPAFTKTAIGYNLPRIAGMILTFCLFSTLLMISIDARNRGDARMVSKTRQFLFPLEFLLMPITGFFLSALPAMLSHTQLMFGKRIEYKVTEKV